LETLTIEAGLARRCSSINVHSYHSAPTTCHLSFLKMATTNPLQNAANYLDDDIEEYSDDAESLASIETDDGEEHLPEKIIAEWQGRHGFIWYLVKWQDCPILRSSWESDTSFDNFSKLLEDWEVEKKKQDRGESKPLDIAAFNKAVLEIEAAERQRRILRRLKRKIKRVISIVTA